MQVSKITRYGILLEIYLLLSGVYRIRISGSATLNKSTVYPGDDTKILTVYSENVTFLEAITLCQHHGGWALSGVWTHALQYVKAAIMRNSRTDLSAGLWTGILRHGNNTDWIRSKCEDVGDVNDNPSLVTNSATELTQCIYINTTTSAERRDNHYYAGSCDVRRPYLCAKRNATLVETFLFLNDTKIEGETFERKTSDISYDACVVLLKESEFSVYAAEYRETNIMTGECFIYTDKTYNLPREISLIEDVERAVILNGRNEVIFNDASYLNLVTTPRSLPCLPTTPYATTTLSFVDEQTSVTTTVSSKSEQTSKWPHTTLSNEQSVMCTCDCSNTYYYNVTSEEMQTKIKELRETLEIDKKSVTSYQRTLTSANDVRASSAVIGSLGVIVLISVVSIIVILDTPLYKYNVMKCEKRNK